MKFLKNTEMKRIIYPPLVILTLIISSLLAGCEKDKYTGSVWYYAYESVGQITHETLGLAAATDFNPYTVAHRNDTLFVANLQDGNTLILLDLKSERPLRTVKTWTFNGQTKNFGSQIEAIVPAGDRLYVAERQSRIHVFTLPQLDYVTCIGNGNWGGPVFQSQAVTVKDGLIFSRDKDGKISVYKAEQATPENYQKINRYKSTNAATANNGFNPHYMELDAEGHILLTDYEGKKLRVLDPSAVNDEMQNGTSIDLDDLAWTTTFKPKTFASCNDRMYMTGDNNAINIYDRNVHEWVAALKSIKGCAFSTPARIYATDDTTLWVSDLSKNFLVKMGVFKGEIREYSRVNERIIEAKSALTRQGEITGSFFVDIKTHEIVDPSDLE